MKQTYLVTGGAGFIGSHIAEYLVQEGHEVRVIDNLYSGRKENLSDFIDEIEFIEGSILDKALLEKAMNGVDIVFHQAARPSVPVSINDPLGTNETNITGTLMVFEVAHKAGVKRVVYASSSSVYGDSPTLPKVETMVTNPLSPYAAQKMMCEKYGKLYSDIFGLETVGLRYFNVFGPRQNPDSEYAAVIPKFIKKIKAGEPVTIFGDGETSRDFTYIDNVVHGNICAGNAESVSGEVFNIALGDEISLNDLVKRIDAICDTETDITYEDFRAGDVKHSCADITKAKEKLSFEPSIPFDEGLQKTSETL